MPASLAPFFSVQFLAPGGAVAAGYKLHTYDTGTSTPKQSFTDQAGTIANANPITLDSEGRCALWLGSGEYAIELRTAAGALVKRWDDVGGIPIPSATAYLPLAGGVAMTGIFELAGPATAALEPVTLDQMTTAIAAAAASLSASITAAGLPIGTIASWLQGSVPTGWLALEGGNVSRTTYAALFTLWGTNYGVGDGSTTFGLPDVRGRFLRAWDNGAGIDAARTLGSTQDDEIKAHTHPLSPNIVTEGLGGAGVGGATSGTDGPIAATSSTGGSETRPKNFSIRYIVKAL